PHRLRIALYQTLDLPVIRTDPRRQLLDQLQQRQERLTDPLRQLPHRSLRKRLRRTPPNPPSHRLHRPTHMVDQLRPRPHHLVPRSDQRQVPLRLFPSVPDRIDQLHIRSPLPRQIPRIQPVALLLPPPPIQPARIPHHHLGPRRPHLPRLPRRVRARRQHHPAPLPPPNVLPHPRPRRHNTPPPHLPPPPVHLTHLAHPIAKIQPHRYLGKQLSAASHRRPPALGPSGPSTVNFSGEQYSTLRRDRPEVGLLIPTLRERGGVPEPRRPRR